MNTFNDLLATEPLVLVDFYADWCGPCKSMEPTIKDVAHDMKGIAKVVKINIDKNERTPAQYNVSGVPTFIIFRNGKEVWRHAGTIDKASLIRQLHQAEP